MNRYVLTPKKLAVNVLYAIRLMQGREGIAVVFIDSRQGLLLR